MYMKRTFILRFAMMALLALGCEAGMAQTATTGKYNVPMAQYPQVDNQGRAIFQLRAPEAKEVVADICGRKYPMTKDANGTWTVTTDPLVVGFHYYFLWIDGVQVTDPGTDAFYGCGRISSALEIPESAEDAAYYTYQQGINHGQVRECQYFSSVEGKPRRCYVYTPAEYETNPNKQYPVLYLQHGFGENEKSWIFHGKVHHIMDALLEENRAVPMLIVMANGMIAEKALNGEETLCYEKFEPFLLEDLMPFIESKYRVKKERDSRAMAGLSLGSIQTSRIVFKHQELFSYAGLFSGFMKNTLDENADNSHIEILKENPEEFNRNMKLFYRGIGTSDVFLRQFLEEDDLCKEYQISQVRKEFQGGHDWNVWRKCISDFLPRLFVSND